MLWKSVDLLQMKYCLKRFWQLFDASFPLKVRPRRRSARRRCRKPGRNSKWVNSGSNVRDQNWSVCVTHTLFGSVCVSWLDPWRVSTRWRLAWTAGAVRPTSPWSRERTWTSSGSRATQREDGWHGIRTDPVSPYRLQTWELRASPANPILWLLFVVPVGYVKIASVEIDFNSLKRCKVQQADELELYDDVAPDTR